MSLPFVLSNALPFPDGVFQTQVPKIEDHGVADT